MHIGVVTQHCRHMGHDAAARCCPSSAASAQACTPTGRRTLRKGVPKTHSVHPLARRMIAAASTWYSRA